MLSCCSIKLFVILRLIVVIISRLELLHARPVDTLLPSPPGNNAYRRAFAVVEPNADHTKLVLVERGLEIISRVANPVAVVSVIGPYRSGKSFLLNQLLSLPCSEGFGVGHMRETNTKGVWVWGEPLELTVSGLNLSLLFFDTEGFESIGKSNVYDDRIFAFAAIMSSVLIYNLPETVREADISRLSFAVEIAEEFYSRVKRLFYSLQSFFGLFKGIS